MKTRRRRGVVAATAALLGLAALAVLAALTTGQASAKTGSESAQSPLRKACGSKIVIQTDWFP